MAEREEPDDDEIAAVIHVLERYEAAVAELARIPRTSVHMPYSLS
jgi:hypothetical protein